MAGEVQGGGEASIAMIGPNVRLALAGRHMGFKNRGDKGSYWELYIDGGAGPTFAQNAHEGGRGRVYTAGFGVVVTTAWMFGFGLSTRFTYGRHVGATAGTSGAEVDIDIMKWDVLNVNLLMLSL
jgi:hypothetical protein